MRTIVIGDIHGSYQSLSEGLKIADFNIETDRIICLGDYVDGWEEPVEVINCLIDIQNRSQFENIFILGNHDSWLISALSEGFDRFRDESFIRSKYSQWLRYDGESTYRAFLKLNDSEIDSIKTNFLNELKPFYIEDNKLFIHAGFDPEIGFLETIQRDPESIIWNRSLFEKALTYSNKSEPVEFDTFSKIYIGHTPTIKYNLDSPLIMGNVINLDQGCKITGRLTLWNDDKNTYVQTNEIERD